MLPRPLPSSLCRTVRYQRNMVVLFANNQTLLLENVFSTHQNYTVGNVLWVFLSLVMFGHISKPFKTFTGIIQVCWERGEVVWERHFLGERVGASERAGNKTYDSLLFRRSVPSFHSHFDTERDSGEMPQGGCPSKSSPLRRTQPTSNTSAPASRAAQGSRMSVFYFRAQVPAGGTGARYV